MTTSTPKSDSGTIRVSDMTIAQLSRGLYRSTATAFKELVNNAYDADATRVRIDTNYPEFDFLSCVDNGMGMSLDEFLRYFSAEGIGSCIKRKNDRDRTEVHERPIIGRLGIGMLAIGQLCHSFKIECHYLDHNKRGNAYKATIVLEDTSIPSRDEVVCNTDVSTKAIDVGKWSYEVIDHDGSKRGFHIYSSDVRQTFRREMKLSLEGEGRQKSSLSLEDMLKRFFHRSTKSIRDCKPYIETIWELAILCPLPYFGKPSRYPFDLRAIAQEDRDSSDARQAMDLIKQSQQRFLSDKFTLIFDGFDLKRFVQLPTEKDVRSRIYFINYDADVFGRKLSFSGYIFAQVSRAIRPLELNGIQVRLRGVGIGGYDSTFLKYYKEIETIRSRWVSGEVFVDNGLESALNIDRDSFNEHDEHYKKLQEVLHGKLNEVFTDAANLSKDRNEKERDTRHGQFLDNLNSMVRKSRAKFKIVEESRGKDVAIVTVDAAAGKIMLNPDARPLKSKRLNALYQAIELAYEIAMRTERSERSRHDLFSTLVKKILKDVL